MAQFDCNLQHDLYQNNYKLGLTANLINHYIHNFYLNKKVNGVFSTQNQCFIGNKIFKFK